jgi:hypothetical protein
MLDKPSLLLLVFEALDLMASSDSALAHKN